MKELESVANAAKHVLNWKPSFKHHQDQVYSLKGVYHLPRLIDLRPSCPQVMDQGQMGSCSGNALAAHYDFLEMKAETPLLLASRLFIYYNERATEGNPGEDAGATTLRDGCVVLQNTGVCSESTWEYAESNLLVKPTEAAYAEAKSHVIGSFILLRSMSDRKHCLATGYPFVFGVPVFESFESDEAARTGIIPMPKPGEQQLGGHALLCVGYDDDRESYIFQNSWGSDWGNKGFAYIPYQYMETLADDFFTLRL